MDPRKWYNKVLMVPITGEQKEHRIRLTDEELKLITDALAILEKRKKHFNDTYKIKKLRKRLEDPRTGRPYTYGW